MHTSDRYRTRVHVYVHVCSTYMRSSIYTATSVIKQQDSKRCCFSSPTTNQHQNMLPTPKDVADNRLYPSIPGLVESCKSSATSARHLVHWFLGLHETSPTNSPYFLHMHNAVQVLVCCCLYPGAFVIDTLRFSIARCLQRDFSTHDLSQAGSTAMADLGAGWSKKLRSACDENQTRVSMCRQHLCNCALRPVSALSNLSRANLHGLLRWRCS